MDDTETPTDDGERPKVLDALNELAPKITRLEAELAAAYDARIALYVKGQQCSPACTQRELARAAGVTPVAVSKVLTRLKARQEVTAGGA